MRTSPRAIIGVGLFLLYLAVIGLVQGTSGVPYTDLGDTAATLWRSGVLSIVLGGLVVAGLAVRLGWWTAALRDTHRGGPRWTLVAPVLYLLVILGLLATSRWDRLGVDFLVAALALGLVVGFAEELVCRGVLLVGLRGSLREMWVWLLTCSLFGLMHGINILLGAPTGETAQQVLSALMQGSALYVLRRVTGSLVWAMILHGAWDFTILVHGETGGAASILQLLTLPAGVLALVAGFVVARNTERGRTESYAVPVSRAHAAA